MARKADEYGLTLRGLAAQAWDASPVMAADDLKSESPTGGICDSLIADIQQLRIELSSTRQTLQRIRSITRRIRLKLLRPRNAGSRRLTQAKLGGVGETALAEAVFAAQLQSKRPPVSSLMRRKRLRPEAPKDATSKIILYRDGRPNKAVSSSALGLRSSLRSPS